MVFLQIIQAISSYLGISKGPDLTSTEEMGAISQKVQKIIDEHAVAVFSKSYCPYCTKSKKSLKNFDANAFVLELDKVPDGSKIQSYLHKKTGQKTVPNIFINQKHIGGNSNLENLKRSGELKKLIAAINQPKQDDKENQVTAAKDSESKTPTTEVATGSGIKSGNSSDTD